MGAVGFEPTKAEPSDLQSDPFVHFGTRPVKLRYEKQLRIFAGRDYRRQRQALQ